MSPRLLDWVDQHVPARLPVATPVVGRRHQAPPRRRGRSQRLCATPHRPLRQHGRSQQGAELAYETVDWTPAEGARLTDALYEEYATAVDPYSRTRMRIRPSSCSPPRWPRSRRRSRPIGRTCRPMSWRMASCPTPSSRASSMPARRIPSYLAGSWTVDATFDVVAAAPRRCRECRPLSPRLVLGRRHRRGQGPAGRRHPSRQLAQGPPPRGLDQQVRQADRGRAARLVRARHGAAAGDAAVTFPPGHADPAGGRRPFYHLRYAAHR